MRGKPRRIANGLALIAGMATATVTGIVGASGDVRTISLYHIHTKETLSVTYKKDGVYLPEALKKINWLMRDWRRNEVISIDPKTIDIAWEMHAELGSTQPIHIICGYRAQETNEMLRRTRGGQASQSQHITGKAIDLAFPDVPIRRLRYSAMIRERGGVGYYPTSALPFVHVDSARVRSWPRMPHDELALLFPNGRSKHMSAEGRSLEPGDASAARRRHPELAIQVAQFFDIRSSPAKTVLLASADQAAPAPPPPKLAVRPERRPEPERSAAIVAALVPPAPPRQAEPKPRLVREPRLVERSSKFTPGPSITDRRKLDDLVTLAALGPAPRLAGDPRPAARPALPPAGMSSLGAREVPPAAPPPPLAAAPKSGPNLPDAAVAALEAETVAGASTAMSFVAAPAYDEDHPEELAYQPFPILPLLTETASADDPALARMVHPDVARTFEMIDDEGGILPMRLRPGAQTAQLLLAQQFTGGAVHLSDFEARAAERTPAPAGFAERVVKTSPR